MVFHEYDGDGWHKHDTLEAAMSGCEKSLEAAREVAAYDGEWPDWVEEIAVYEAPENCEEPDEDGKLIVKTFMIDIREAEPGERCDFYCEYRIGKLAENID